MPARTRDLLLTLHVLTSIGWFGAVVVFLVLAILGLTSAQPQITTAAYLSMDVASAYVIVPLCAASLATGVVQSLATRWGLLRHYWVVIKLVLTVLATAVLLLHTLPIGEMARMALTMPIAAADHRGMRIQLVFDASAALVVLTVVTGLGVLKPRGMTRRGRRFAAAAGKRS